MKSKGNFPIPCVLLVSLCAILTSSCCQSFWVSQGSLSDKTEDLRATVYLIDSTCDWRSGYLLRVENRSRVFAERFIQFKDSGKDYEADFKRVVLDSLKKNKLTFHYTDEEKTRVRDVLFW